METEPIYLSLNLKKVMAELLLAQALKIEAVEEVNETETKE